MRPLSVNRNGSRRFRLLITGASGFVGRHLVDLIGANWGDSVELLCGGPNADLDFDLNDPASIRAAALNLHVDAAIHLAATSSIVEAREDMEQAWRVNVSGAAELAKLLSHANPALTFLFASSAEVYGDAFLDGIVDEDTVPRPRSGYGHSKLAAEQAIAALLPGTASLVVTRPSNHIGPRQDQKFAIASFASQLAAGEKARKPVTIKVGNLDVERDFMDVRDVARGYLDLVRLAQGRGVRATYNMATGKSRPIRALLDHLRSIATIESEVTVDATRVRPAEIPTVRICTQRIAEAIGWEPRISLDNTLQAIMDDARERAAELA